LFSVVLLICAAAICGSWWLRDLSVGATDLKFFYDAGAATIQVFGAILAIAATVQLFFLDVEEGTAGVLLSSRLSRWEWIVGKLAGMAICMLAFVALMTLSWIIAWFAWDWNTGSEYGGRAVPMEEFPLRFLAFAGVQFLQLVLLCAIALFIASISESMVYAVCVSVLFLAICQLRFLVEHYDSRIPSALGRAAVWTVARVFPDFHLYSITAGTFAPEQPFALWFLGLSLYTGVYATAFVALAVFSIHRREL
jgi:ABC-type transport system involved in multi-copper enzyme maturation permease subunit